MRDVRSPDDPNTPNGYLEMGSENWEILFAMSMEAKPTLLIP